MSQTYMVVFVALLGLQVHGVDVKLNKKDNYYIPFAIGRDGPEYEVNAKLAQNLAYDHLYKTVYVKGKLIVVACFSASRYWVS